MEEYQVRVYSDRTVWYNTKDQKHRLDGPAIEWTNGSKRWYQNGMRHRIDGPAIVYAGGYKAWYQDDIRHRLDGPAVEYPNGESHWFKNGKLHRLDGPAIEWANGDKEWYIEGQKLTEEEFNRRIKISSQEGREVEIDGVIYILKAK